MLSFFRKEKISANTKQNAAQDKLANRIVSACIRWQQKWADFMQRRAERLSANGKRIALVLFCLVSGSLSLYLIANSLLKRRPSNIHIVQLSQSHNAAKAGDENIKAKIIISKGDYQKIQRFRYYMDSLSNNSSGRRTYDSILIHRSGLMDSLYLIEKIYQSQNEK